MNHVKSVLIISLTLFVLPVKAGSKFKIDINKSDFKLNKIVKTEGAFTQIAIAGFESDKTIGSPELPVKSWLVKGTPKQIQVHLNVQSTEIFPNAKPFPTQEQDCRCTTDKLKIFTPLAEESSAPVSISYLGAYRGTPISKIDLRMGSYDANKNEIRIISRAQVDLNAELFSLPRAELKDYLILAPLNLVDSLSEFISWKQSKGYTVYVEPVTSPSNDLTALKNLIRQYYTEKGIDFAILVGDETAIPMFKVSTSGSSQTPSDLKYFTMDGVDDYIPDVFASRIVATTPEDVAAQLSKSIEFERRSYENSEGLKRIIGIASNEGSKPSDNEYVKSIEDKFKQVLGVDVVHLYQNDSTNSTPTVLNSTFNQGALWLTYLGHGSGTSWPSMYRQYAVAHIEQMKNKSAVKPIIIDVACMNGRLVNGYLGTSFMKAKSSEAFGAAAYYGGTVNISWHPPAVMARGIAYEHLTKKFLHLGEALLAGNLYLAANWANQADVVDNFEWYHLQGDPGMNIEF